MAMVLSRRDVAERLKISVRVLRGLEAAKQMPPRVRLSRQMVGYLESDIDRFIQEKMDITEF